MFEASISTTRRARVRARTRGTGIAYISQDPMVALDPCFTVASQLGELVGRHEKLRGADRRERVLELLRQVGLPDPADAAARFPHQLSGGMAQRVSIACALAGRPRVLIADEPTTALDVTIQGEILDLLRRLQAETGMAIVLITHDLGVVADLCDRVAVMYAGEIVEIADVESALRAPSASLHARPARLQSDRQRSAAPPLPAIPGTVPSPAELAGRLPLRRPLCDSASPNARRARFRSTRRRRRRRTRRAASASANSTSYPSANRRARRSCPMNARASCWRSWG